MSTIFRFKNCARIFINTSFHRLFTTMPKLPDRWENYTNIGSVIPGTRFITFKVPLREELCKYYPDDLWFTPQVLIETTREQETPLGLVIDLTFTKRYYPQEHIQDEGVEYEKIFVNGHVIPSNDIIWQFFSVVDNFLENCTDENKVIGVHCTHGVNRTGYCVARYMIEKLGIKPDEAINAIGKARGYPIERENYLQDLRQRSLKTAPTEPEAGHENGSSNPVNGHQFDRKCKSSDSGWHGNEKKRHVNGYDEHNRSQSEYDQYGNYSSSNGYNSVQNNGYSGRFDSYGSYGNYDDYGSYGYQHQSDCDWRRHSRNPEHSAPVKKKDKQKGDMSIAGSSGSYGNWGSGAQSGWHGNQHIAGHGSSAMSWGAGAYGAGQGNNSYNSHRGRDNQYDSYGSYGNYDDYGSYGYQHQSDCDWRRHSRQKGQGQNTQSPV